LAGSALPAAFGVAPATAQPAANQPEGPPQGARGHADLATLFTAFDAWRTPPAVDGVVDYSPAAVDRRRAELRGFQAQLPDFAVARWDRHQQVDYLAVRAQMDLEDFNLNILKPWARDPGMYVDELQRLAYTDLPLKADALARFRA